MGGAYMAWKPWLSLILVAMGLLAACSDPASVETERSVDVEQLRQSLLAQDRRFADVAYIEGAPEAYRRFMAEDAVQLPDGGLAIGGREEIYQMMLGLTEGIEFNLTWEPVDAQVAKSGELGFTWGIYYYESVDELGAPYVAEGKYVYLWRHNAGRWELILDITNQTEPDYQEYEEWLEEEYLEEVPPDLEAGELPEGVDGQGLDDKGL